MIKGWIVPAIREDSIFMGYFLDEAQFVNVLDDLSNSGLVYWQYYFDTTTDVTRNLKEI